MRMRIFLFIFLHIFEFRYINAFCAKHVIFLWNLFLYFDLTSARIFVPDKPFICNIQYVLLIIVIL